MTTATPLSRLFQTLAKQSDTLPEQPLFKAAMIGLMIGQLDEMLSGVNAIRDTIGTTDSGSGDKSFSELKALKQAAIEALDRELDAAAPSPRPSLSRSFTPG